MPRKEEEREKQGATPMAAPSHSGGPTIELPCPTQDQQDYLEHIKQSTGRYDPNIVVGGPRASDK